MRIGITVVWCVFMFIFVSLGIKYSIEAGKKIPPFKVTQREFQKPESPVQVTIGVAGTPLDKPLQDFAQDFNEYLDDQNKSLHSANILTAWGYFAAALTAFLSGLVEWREHLGKIFRPRRSFG